MKFRRELHGRTSHVAKERGRFPLPASGAAHPGINECSAEMPSPPHTHLLDICCDFRIFHCFSLTAAALMFGCRGGREEAAGPFSEGWAPPPATSCLEVCTSSPSTPSRVVLNEATLDLAGTFKNTDARACPREPVAQMHSRTESSCPRDR